MDAKTCAFWFDDATLRCWACLRVLALLGLVRQAGLPGAFRCALPFLLPFSLHSYLAWPPAS